MKVRGFIAGASLWCAAALGVTQVQAREVFGVTMPEVVVVAGQNLRLNGMGVRTEKLFFKGYVIALYLETPTTSGSTAIQSDEAKQIVLTMLRDVSRDAFVHAIESGMIRNSAAVMPTLRARLDMLEKALPNLRKGDVIDLTWQPGTGTLVRGHGNVMTIPGKDFADAFFSVWLGPNPVESGLKRALLGGA
jgi:hypothetical protein